MSKEMFFIREEMINVVEYYSHLSMKKKSHKLSKKQKKQLTETRDRLLNLGEIGILWAGLATEILSA